MFVADCLDDYIKELSRSFPKEVPASIFADISSDGRPKRLGLPDRVKRLGSHASIDRATSALAECAMVYRNQTAHPSRQIKLGGGTIGDLLRSGDDIQESYQGLDVSRLIDHVGSGRTSAVTFKETASMLSAVHRFVRGVDTSVLQTTDLSVLLESTLATYVFEREPKRRAVDVWGRGEAEAVDKIFTIAANVGGFTSVDTLQHCVEPDAISRLANLSPEEALHRLAPTSTALD